MNDYKENESWGDLVGKIIAEFISIGAKVVFIWGILHVIGSPF